MNGYVAWCVKTCNEGEGIVRIELIEELGGRWEILWNSDYSDG